MITFVFGLVLSMVQVLVHVTWAEVSLQAVWSSRNLGYLPLMFLLYLEPVIVSSVLYFRFRVGIVSLAGIASAWIFFLGWILLMPVFFTVFIKEGNSESFVELFLFVGLLGYPFCILTMLRGMKANYNVPVSPSVAPH